MSRHQDGIEHPGPKPEEATRLAAAPYPRYYDISPDGQRFLTIGTTSSIDKASAVADLVVVQNWFEELRQRVPVP